MTEAIEIETKINEIIAVYESLEKVPETIILPTSEYEGVAKKAHSMHTLLLHSHLTCKIKYFQMN